ncbi:MAG: ribosome biogenesis GTP-binding protein YihA/YsxC [Thermovirgaceae bacterium]
MTGANWSGTLVTTSYTSDQLPAESLPEIAFAGRSNVGKSSLINALLKRRIAKVSREPGKTRSLNFYIVQAKRAFQLVDLPGFGFAKRGKKERAHWADLIEGYIAKRGSLTLVIHLVDFRHGMLENDRQLQHWLSVHRVPFLIVFTKTDKIPTTKRVGLYRKHLKDLPETIGAPLCVSTEKNITVDELRETLDDFLARLSEDFGKPRKGDDPARQ